VKHRSALPAAQVPHYVIAAINAPGRPAKDRESDASRRPVQVMAFFGVKPGMQVADLWAGGGYTTELLARIVGPTGKVYSQNTAFPDKSKKNEVTWKGRGRPSGYRATASPSSTAARASRASTAPAISGTRILCLLRKRT